MRLRLLLALLIPLAGCTGLRVHVGAHMLASGLYAIERYDATISERGILRADPETEVVKRVRYGRLWRVDAEVLSPAEHAGMRFVFDGETLSVWWPRYFFGLRVRNLTVPPRNEVGDAIFANTEWLLNRYEIDEHPAAPVAGRAVQEWVCTPDEPAPWRFTYQAAMDAKYFVPLRVDVQDHEGTPWYSMRFDAVDFETELPADAFAFEFPEGAIVHDWDLAAPGVSLAEADERTEFPVLLPEHLPPGHALKQVLLSDHGDVHGVALIMNHRARWLSLSEIPNMGPILVPELGLPVRIGEREGVLNFVFGFTVISWAVDTTALTLIGNLPYPQLIEVAASVRPRGA